MIIKTVKSEKYLQLDNNTLRDANLSLDTRGFHHHLLSYSKEFEISAESLMTMFNIGREKLLRITNELKQFGYLQIRGKRDGKGVFVGKEWIFYDVSQQTDFRASRDAGEPDVGLTRSSDEPDDIKKDESSQKNDLKGSEKTGEENPPANAEATEETEFDNQTGEPYPLPEIPKKLFASTADIPVINQTENAIGRHLDITVWNAISELIPPELEDKWTDFVKARKLTIPQNADAAQLRSKFGYFLSDFQRESRFDFANLKKPETTLPTISEVEKEREEYRKNQTYVNPESVFAM